MINSIVNALYYSVLLFVFVDYQLNGKKKKKNCPSKCNVGCALQTRSWLTKANLIFESTNGVERYFYFILSLSGEVKFASYGENIFLEEYT